jgi:hypothetical protein
MKCQFTCEIHSALTRGAVSVLEHDVEIRVELIVAVGAEPISAVDACLLLACMLSVDLLHMKKIKGNKYS